jgi:hypothetical protein
VDEMVKLASLIFTGATVLVGIELFFLSSTWRSYKEVSSNWPLHRRGIPNAYLLDLLHAGCWLLGFSIFFNVAALVGVIGMMLGLHLGTLQPDNLYQARYGVFIGGFLFICGMLFIGGVRFEEALYWHRSRVNPLVFQPSSTQEGNSPTVGLNPTLTAVHTARMSAKSWTIFGLLLGFIMPPVFHVVFSILTICFWYKLLIWLGIVIVLFSLMRSYRFLRFLRFIGDKAFGTHTYF